METPSEKTEKDTFLSSASLNSGGINRTAEQLEGASAEEKRKSGGEESPDRQPRASRSARKQLNAKVAGEAAALPGEGIHLRCGGEV